MTAVAGLSLGKLSTGHVGSPRNFKISCAGWSLHREVFEGRSAQIDLFRVVREEFGIGAFELVNTMLEVPTANYISRLRREAEKHDVVIPLIMVDGEGHLGDKSASERKRAVRNHAKWIYIASDLGCHSVRVNWSGYEAGVEKDRERIRALVGRSVDAFRSLVELGRSNGVDILIENHGGPSSYPDLLVDLIKAVNMPNLGTLPDFGNFPSEVDRYGAVNKMMPFARAVSAKCHDFNEEGDETVIDFERMLRIVVDQHQYRGYIGIEYEGRRLPEREGIRACRDLLIRLRG
jgi:sugar phosphate isomerase/epimerase